MAADLTQEPHVLGNGSSDENSHQVYSISIDMRQLDRTTTLHHATPCSLYTSKTSIVLISFQDELPEIKIMSMFGSVCHACANGSGVTNVNLME